MPAHAHLPVLLLPGMDGTGELLQPLANRLSARRPVQVVAYPDSEPRSYDELTAFVLQRAPPEPFAILGESFSGPIAIEIAATDRRVAGLILASSFAHHPMPALSAGLARALDPRLVPRRVVEGALLGSAGTPDIKADLARVLARLPPRLIRARIAEVLGVDKRDRLRAVTCPMLYLRGRFDRLVRGKSRDEITFLQPGCEVQTFDAPHMLLETHPAEAAAAIDRFCTRLTWSGVSSAP